MLINAPAYGSDPSGLVCGYLFGRDHQPLPIEAGAAQEWLDQPGHHEGEFIWLHFNLANAASEKWMKEHVVLAEEFYESLHEGQRSTRIELADNALIAVVNDVVHDFSFDPSDIATLWLSVDRQVVISARRQPLKAIEGLRQAVRGGEPIRSPAVSYTHLTLPTKA